MKPTYVFMLLVIWCSLLSGCWNRRELNELAVSVAIGVDKKEKGILLSDQILNAGAIAQLGSSYATVNLFEQPGLSFQEAARRMTTKSTKKIYVGQLQMLVLGESFAKEGVAQVLDHISRDHEYRNDFLVVVARKIKARDVLKILTPLEKAPATKLKNSLEVSAAVWGETSAVEFRAFTSNVISKGKEAVLTGVTVKGSIEKGNDIGNVGKIFPGARLAYAGGLAVFKQDKLIGWLNDKESIGYNFTQGNIKSTVLLLPCPNSSRVISVELLRTKSKMTASIKNDRPLVQIVVKADGVVTDAQCPIDLTTPATLSKLKEASNAQISSYIKATVRKIQQHYNSDIFGFGQLFRRKYPEYWKKHEKDWYEVFPTIEVNIQPNVNVRQMYKTTKSIEERMKGG